MHATKTLYGDTELIVEGLKLAGMYARLNFTDQNKANVFFDLAYEIEDGKKILDPWEIEDVYAQTDDSDREEAEPHILTERQAIAVLTAFDDRDKSSDNEVLADIANDLFNL